MAEHAFDAFIPMVVSAGFFLLTPGIVFVIADGRRVMGGIIAACGIGFIVSTLASYRRSKTLGLVNMAARAMPSRGLRVSGSRSQVPSPGSRIPK